MEDIKVTLLDVNQVIGERILDVIKNSGKFVKITDFAICLGGYYLKLDGTNDIYGMYWTKTREDDYSSCVKTELDVISHNTYKRFIGIRPVLTNFDINNFSVKTDNRGIKYVEYGMYPQSIVSEDLEKILFNDLLNNKLIETKNEYVIDLATNYSEKFRKDFFYEYEYNGKKYVNIYYMKGHDSKDQFYLSNGKKYKKGDMAWIEVEPIKWLYDEKNNLLISDKILLSGVQFNPYGEIYHGDFENTFIYKFLNTYFIKDIQQNIQKDIEIRVEYEKTKQEIELETIAKTKQKLLKLKRNL